MLKHLKNKIKCKEAMSVRPQAALNVIEVEYHQLIFISVQLNFECFTKILDHADTGHVSLYPITSPLQGRRRFIFINFTFVVSIFFSFSKGQSFIFLHHSVPSLFVKELRLKPSRVFEQSGKSRVSFKSWSDLWLCSWDRDRAAL